MAQSTYTQYYSNFVGADMSSDARVVARNRLAYSVNMWRDYESNQGAAVETFPGFRSIADLRDIKKFKGKIAGLWHYKGPEYEYILFQKGDSIYSISLYDFFADDIEPHPSLAFQGVNPNGVIAFANNNKIYIISKSYREYEAKIVVLYEENGLIVGEDINNFYIPTTYYNGRPYEQRNGIGDSVLQIETNGGIEDSENTAKRNIPLYEKVQYNAGLQIEHVLVDGKKYQESESNAGNGTYFVLKMFTTFPSGTTKGYSEVVLQFSKQAIYNSESKTYKKIEIKYKAEKTKFNIIGNLTPWQNDNMTMSDAILGCTKSTVYDGRVFLTGNPELPNTVFYSQRNLTGANDPTYFGVYNYFNDGDGNTPNVDLLATPSMLMVIKKDTVQDGSVYYHVGTNNTHSDESVRNLVPRIYPSTQGAAGVGSAADTEAYSLSCNFLDDPVFLSQRGLKGVSKEQLNAERTIGHRSSNVDKLLVREYLAHASIAEWKGYLVICCNGHIYLADSRAVSQHRDGSYQYEWFYLQDVGTYENYEKAYETITSFPLINDLPLGEYLTRYNGDTKVSDEYSVSASVINVPESKIRYNTAYSPYALSFADSVSFYSYESDDGRKYVVSENESQKFGSGKFYGAQRVLAVGNLLFFATDYDICVFNTDQRGVNIIDANGNIIREVDNDKIDSSWYTFNGVPYRSACALRLDDCDKKSLTKTTIYGTTVARLKMMPGSKCKIKSSINGRDWQDLAEVYSTRQDFSDLRFDNMSFAENEDNVAVLPEVSRGWIQKQYYFESDGYCEPFGLYELSYIYKIAGKIRYV